MVLLLVSLTWVRCVKFYTTKSLYKHFNKIEVQLVRKKKEY